MKKMRATVRVGTLRALLIVVVLVCGQSLASRVCAQCVTPFGTELGSFQGVPVYSNCRRDYNSDEDNYACGHYTGVKWQCVEFVRRFYYCALGYDQTLPTITYAYQTWDAWPAAGLVRYTNGEIAPQPYDILVWSSAVYGTGHVAIVESVTSDSVTVIEQNWSNSSCERTLGRSGNSIDASGLIGWLRRPGPGCDDPTPPDISLSPAEISGWYTTPQTVSWTVTDSGCSGLNTVAIWWDGGAHSNVPANSSTPMLEGIHVFHILAYDKAGNYTPIDRTYRLDTTPPVFTGLTVSASTTTLAVIWNTVDLHSGVTQYQYRIGTTPGGQEIMRDTLIGARPRLYLAGLSLTAGRIYYFTVRAKNGAGLWNSPTTYGFRVSDGTDPGPLSSPSVSPASGTTATDFTFSVVYRQTGNRLPDYAYVVVCKPDGTRLWKTMTTSGSGPWDGSYSLYTCTTKLPAGSLAYYFQFKAGSQVFATGKYTGPVVYSLPTLSVFPVNPASGTPSTSFVFSVIYTQAQNMAPDYGVMVIVKRDGTQLRRAMATTDTTYKDGSLYTYQTTLPYGTYTCYYEFKGVGVVIKTGVYNGPTVN